MLNSDSEAVTVMFLVSAGARHEEESEQGIAHFVEHTIFKGTENRPDSKEIGIEIETLGGQANAFTAQDYTGYYIKAPARNFNDTIEILTDLFLNSTFPEEEIAKEKGVIIEEIRMYEDQPMQKITHAWQDNFFQDHPLARDIAGTEESVGDMQVQQFRRFIEKQYSASNVLLVVAGKADQEQIENFIEQSIEPNISPGEKNEIEQFVFSKSDKRKKELVLEKDVQQTHYMLGGLGLNRNHEDRYIWQTLITLLGNGFGSRLFQTVREDLGAAYYVYARGLSFQDTGVFQIGMGVDFAKLNSAKDAVRVELEKLVNGEIAEKDILRAKNYLLGNIVTDMETSDDLASFYGMQRLLSTQQLSIEEIKQRLLSVNSEDLSRVAQTIFTEENKFEALLKRKN
ncbi:MAG: M16 family metallopeptidase [Candidatus Dojkabacteria bacterium]